MARRKAVPSNVAVGNIQDVSGEVNIAGGDIHIGNVYQTPEDDIPLSSDEIENGLTRFAQYLPERAPVLQDSFSSIAKKLRATIGADQNSLSPTLKKQREETLDTLKAMCMEVTDISFRAMCLGQNPPPYDSRSPFLGLFAFRPEDREFFFGRDALVQKLVARIKDHPFLAVLGASGSGKSSLVMAGLVPALEAQMSYITPSSAPLSQLLTAKESASAKTIFVIDQFEELFTHPHDAAERADFIHALLELTKTNRVVITMRADFWGEVAIYTDLKQAMQEHQELIAPMNVDELHSAMEKQAAVVGLRFDPTLSESILAEVKGEPGAMPLLQHALWELWNRRHGLWIKAEEYQAFGGVKQAIASTAEEVYASCSEFERTRVRDIFLRLTRLDPDGSGEGRDTRRRVLIEELIPANSDNSATIKLLDKLADARLIVKTDKDVEVAHEALIRHWSRLTEWLNEDRDNLRLREGVSESAREWENSKRDDSLLNHRGGRLELALVMSKLTRYQLNPLEHAYLNSCLALRHKEQRERERRLHWIVIASVAAAVIFLVLGSFGLIKSNEAVSQAGTAQANANAAETAKANAEIEKQNAIEQASIARSGELASYASPLINNQLDLSLLLGIEAMRSSETYQAKSVLLTAFNTSPYLEQFLFGNTTTAGKTLDINNFPYLSGGGSNVAFSPDGKILASGGCGEIYTTFEPDAHYYCTQGEIILWDAISHQRLGLIKSHTGLVSALVFSPDGNTLAASRSWNNWTSDDLNQIILWDVTNPANPTQIGLPLVNSDLYEIRKTSFSPDGRFLAVIGTNTQAFEIWDITTLKMASETLGSEHYGELLDLVFSPDGKTLAIGGCAEFNDQGNCAQGEIILWDVKNGHLSTPILLGHTNYVLTLAFSPDGKILASGSCANSLYDTCVRGEILLWDMQSRQRIQTLALMQDHSDAVKHLIFSPDGKMLISGGFDKSIIIWDIEPKILYGKYQDVTRDSYLADSQETQLKTAYSAIDNLLPQWDSFAGLSLNLPFEWQTRKSISFLGISGKEDGFNNIVNKAPRKPNQESIEGTVVSQTSTGYLLAFDGMVLSPNGNTLAIGHHDGTVILWNLSYANSGIRHSIGKSGSNSNDAIAFRPDGRTFATINDRSEIIFWDADTLNISTFQLRDPNTGILIQAQSIAISPNGKVMAAGGINGEIVLWDLTNNEYIGTLKGHSDWINNLVFSPDGNLLASTAMNENITVLWDVSTLKSAGNLVEKGSTWISDLAFSPDGNFLAMSSDPNSRSFALWEVNTRSLVEKIDGQEGGTNYIAFSPDGNFLATGNGVDVILWNTATLQPIGQPLRGKGAITITGLAFSPDGKTLAVAAQASDIILWDIATHQVIGRLFSEWFDWAHNPVFSPDGRFLVSSISSGSLVIWEMDSQLWVNSACRIVGRNFTHIEWMQYFSALSYPASQDDATCPQWPIEAESTPTPSPTP